MARRPSGFQVDHARVDVLRGPRDDGRWYWRARVADGAGKRPIVWSGWATRDEAGAAVRVALDETAPAHEELRTVRDLLECWVAAQQSRRDVSDLTRKTCQVAGNRLVSHGLAEVRLDTLDRRAIERHRDEALRAGESGATVTRDLKYLRQAWTWAVESGLIPNRVLPRVRIERVRPVYSRFTPDTDQVAQLLDGVSERVRRALVLLASTGCRVSEILLLTWARVPLDASRLRVDGKTGERWVELHPAVSAELRTWERAAPTQRVIGISSNTVRKALARRSAELGLPKVSPNGLRRHVVDALYRTGRIDAAASQLGHSAATALSVYRQVTERDRRAAVESADLGAVVRLERSQGRSQVGGKARVNADRE